MKPIVDEPAASTPIRWALAGLSLSMLLSSLGTTSAIGTALGPSLGGFLIAGLGWRAIFLVNVPLGVLTFVLAWRHLPADQTAANRPRFDLAGTVLLAVTLAAYALAMTVGGNLGIVGSSLGIAGLLLMATAGLALFVRTERRSVSPLIRPTVFRDRALDSSLAMSVLVSTVMMSTLVVGPFYLSRALGLEPTLVGLVLSVGPLVAALTGVPAGRLADRIGVRRMVVTGLTAIAAGTGALALLPAETSSPDGAGVAGYLIPIVVVTTGYAIFQTANNTSVMSGLQPDQRGVVSGLLNLSRNLGLITGASVMGAVFALASGTANVATADPGAVAQGMRITFGVAALLIVGALLLARVRPGVGPRSR